MDVKGRSGSSAGARLSAGALRLYCRHWTDARHFMSLLEAVRPILPPLLLSVAGTGLSAGALRLYYWHWTEARHSMEPP